MYQGKGAQFARLLGSRALLIPRRGNAARDFAVMVVYADRGVEIQGRSVSSDDVCAGSEIFATVEGLLLENGRAVWQARGRYGIWSRE